MGSSQSVAPVNIALNAAVACALDDIATELEGALASGKDLTTSLQELLPRLFREHMPVVFNGNGYSADWPLEAARRGLPNHANTVDALTHYTDPEVMEVFVRPGVLTEREVTARQEILLESYAKTVRIEGQVLADMVRGQILPAARKAQAAAAEVLLKTREATGESRCPAEEAQLADIRSHADALQDNVGTLEAALAATAEVEGAIAQARAARDAILPVMGECRVHADALERLVEDSAWPLPKYAELLWVH